MDNVVVLSIIAIVYLALVGYLGFRGFRGTRTSSDYMVAGRKAHPFVMALSYGATFISTSAIVGFGGAASMFGMSLLWLVFLNIFVGIFIAFLVFGRRTRRMGHHLQAHTFPELLGRRFNSRFIQGFAGLVIVVFMPLYAAAVLIAGARYLENTFQIDFTVAVAVFGIVIAGYVVAGGLKGVMYADALQGTLMFLGMIVLAVFTYWSLGGVVNAHKRLDNLPQTIESEAADAARLLAQETPLPVGASAAEAAAWLSEQSQAVAVAEEREAAGGEGEALALSEEAAAARAFVQNRPVEAGRLNSLGYIEGWRKGGWRGWTSFPATGSPMWYVLVTSILAGVGIGVLAQPQLAVRFMTVNSARELNRAVLVGGVFILSLPGVAYSVGNLTNVWFFEAEHGGMISFAKAGGNIDKVIPAFINEALPAWFGALFMLTLLSAAMSTLSSQFHAMGTAIGRDVFEKGLLGAEEHGGTVAITRVGIVLAIIGTVLLSLSLPAGIVAIATAMFFGLCAAAFLPVYVGGLFWPRMTKAGAIASLVAGFGVSFFWLTFVLMPKGKLPAVLADALFGKPTIWPEPWLGVRWNHLEALFVALPVSALAAVVVSLLTRPEPDAHLSLCYEGAWREQAEPDGGAEA